MVNRKVKDGTSGEASPTIYSCYVNFLELMVFKNNQFLKKWIIIELSLTIEIYIAGEKIGLASPLDGTEDNGNRAIK